MRGLGPQEAAGESTPADHYTPCACIRERERERERESVSQPGRQTGSRHRETERQTDRQENIAKHNEIYQKHSLL